MGKQAGSIGVTTQEAEEEEKYTKYSNNSIIRSSYLVIEKS
jgi:hypothetical protein